MKKLNPIYLKITMVVMVFQAAACKKLIDIPPPDTKINSENVFTNDGSAAAVLNGIYGNMSSMEQGLSGPFASFEYLSLSADELTLYDINNPSLSVFYKNNLAADGNFDDLWTDTYPVIFQANDAIRGLIASTTLTAKIRSQLLGEAYFIRAYCYFYLVNIYGDVPLVTTIDPKVNSTIARAPKDQVWQQIITDLQTAQGLMGGQFLGADGVSSSTERSRPTKWAAEALLARAYLYTKNYTQSITATGDVISQTGLFTLPALTAAFTKNSTETIWALQPVKSFPSPATGEGFLFVLPAAGPSAGAGGNPVYLSNNVLNAFEPGDQRKLAWVGQVTAAGVVYNYPYKYKAGNGAASATEYAIQFRLAEQYLIRAEAEAANNDLVNAVKDLNAVRSRAGLAGYAGATDAISLQAAILHERQVELFTENGHRWFDLKRTGRIDAVMTTATVQKGGTWKTTAQLFPITRSQLLADPNLQQNPGY